MSLTQLEWNPPARICRQFGFAGLVVLALLGLWVSSKSSVFGVALRPTTVAWVTLALWTAAAACGVLALLAPRTLRWPFVTLSLVAWPIGWVVSHLLMAVLYYGLITPIGLIVRLIGRDPMARRIEPSQTSYWRPHGPPAAPERYFRQS